MNDFIFHFIAAVTSPVTAAGNVAPTVTAGMLFINYLFLNLRNK